MEEIPRSFLDSFRVVYVQFPDYMRIFHACFHVLGIEKPQDLAKNLELFLKIMSYSIDAQYFLFKNDLDNQYLDYLVNYRKKAFNANYLNPYHIIQFMWMYFLESKNPINLSPEQVLLKAIEIEFRSKSSNKKHFSMVKFIFDSVFDSQSSNSFATGQTIMSQQYKEHIINYLNNHHLAINKEIIQTVTFINDCLVNNQSLIISGKASSSKSLIIKIAAYVYGKINKINFQVNQIKLNSIDSEYLLGCFSENKNQWNKGVLEQLVEQMNQRQDAEFLLKNEIFSQYRPLTSQYLAVEKDKDLPEIYYHNHLDWLIFDVCNLSLEYPNTLNLIEVLLSSCQQKKICLLNGNCMRLPEESRVLFEMENIQNLSPLQISQYYLKIIGQECFSLREEFQNWWENITEKQPMLVKFDYKLKECFIFFLEEVLKYIENLPKNRKICQFSQKFYLMNFLNYFQIQFNEFSKQLLAHGFLNDFKVDDKDISNHLDFSKNLQQSSSFLIMDNIDIDRVNLLAFAFSQGINLDQEPEKEKYLQISMKEHYQNKFKNYIEAIFVFNIVWAVGISLKPQFQTDFSKFLLDLIHNYQTSNQKKNTPNQYNFACSLYGILKNKENNGTFNIFKFIFNIISGQWEKWEDFSGFDLMSSIKSNFQCKELEIREIVRLNPFLFKLQSIKDIINSKPKDSYLLPHHMLHIETCSSKIARFFVDYSICYQKQSIFLGVEQNGKTLLMKNRIFSMISSGKFKSIQISMTKQMGLPYIQSLFENSYFKKYTDVMKPLKDSFALVFIDDFHLVRGSRKAVGISEFFRSLVENQGWMSQKKNRFIELENVALIANYSFPIQYLETDENKDVFGKQDSCIPKSLLQKMMLIKMPGMSFHDISQIFAIISENIIQKDIQMKDFQIEIAQQVLLFSYLVKKSQKSFSQISQIYQCNLRFSQAIEIIKQIGNFELQLNEYSDIHDGSQFDNSKKVSEQDLLSEIQMGFSEQQVQDSQRNESDDNEEKFWKKDSIKENGKNFGQDSFRTKTIQRKDCRLERHQVDQFLEEESENFRFKQKDSLDFDFWQNVWVYLINRFFCDEFLLNSLDSDDIMDFFGDFKSEKSNLSISSQQSDLSNHSKSPLQPKENQKEKQDIKIESRHQEYIIFDGTMSNLSPVTQKLSQLLEQFKEQEIQEERENSVIKEEEESEGGIEKNQTQNNMANLIKSPPKEQPSYMESLLLTPT